MKQSVPNMVTPISKIPSALRGLWNHQYAPMEKQLMRELLAHNGEYDVKLLERLEWYRSASVAGKMLFMDRIHASSAK
jgi:hypothetical protein